LDVTKLILSFVGNNQYRFVAATNQQFKAAYLQIFSENKTTKISAQTLKHTAISWEEYGKYHEQHGGQFANPSFGCVAR
jgi:hypothetical protein